MWLNLIGVNEIINEPIDILVFYIFCGVSGLALILFLLSIIVIGCVTKRWGYMPGVDQSIMAGGLFLCACVLIRGLSLTWLNGHSFEILCQVFPAIMTLGLSYFFGGLLVKACSMLDHHRTVRSAERPFRLWKPALGMLILLLIDGAIIVVWSVMFRNDYKTFRDKTTNVTRGFECCSPSSEPMAKDYFEWAVSAYHAFLLLLAALMVWPALYKVISGVAATEAKFTTFITYFVLLACVVPGVVIHFLLWQKKDGRISHTIYYAVSGGLTLFAVVITMILLIISQVKVGSKIKRGKEYQ